MLLEMFFYQNKSSLLIQILLVTILLFLKSESVNCRNSRFFAILIIIFFFKPELD